LKCGLCNSSCTLLAKNGSYARALRKKDSRLF
jgi:hypothetical protein